MHGARKQRKYDRHALLQEVAQTVVLIENSSMAALLAGAFSARRVNLCARRREPANIAAGSAARSRKPT